MRVRARARVLACRSCVWGGEGQGGYGLTGAGVWLRACSLTNPACNAPPYFHLRPLRLHDIFQHYLINSTIFGKELLNIICVFCFSLQSLFDKFLILRSILRDISVNVDKFACKVTVNLFGFQRNLNFLDRFCKKSSNIKFDQNPSCGSRVVPCGQTDVRTYRG